VTDALFVVWQDPNTRSWYPVGRLTASSSKQGFDFVYTKGAAVAPGFIAFGGMKDLDKIYSSASLFPLFSNRLLSSSRPEYSSLLEWLDIAGNDRNPDPVEVLALTEGVRKTDSLAMFRRPLLLGDGGVEAKFFVHGIRYLPDCSVKRIDQLVPGEKLLPLIDICNAHDGNAIAIRSEDPKVILGYLPRYLSSEVRDALLDKGVSRSVEIEVKRINLDAPVRYRLMCCFRARIPSEYKIFCAGDYEPLAPQKKYGDCGSLHVADGQ
jgi:hypothetical protein